MDSTPNSTAFRPPATAKKRECRFPARTQARSHKRDRGTPLAHSSREGHPTAQSLGEKATGGTRSPHANGDIAKRAPGADVVSWRDQEPATTCSRGGTWNGEDIRLATWTNGDDTVTSREATGRAPPRLTAMWAPIR